MADTDFHTSPSIQDVPTPEKFADFLIVHVAQGGKITKYISAEFSEPGTQAEYSEKRDAALDDIERGFPFARNYFPLYADVAANMLQKGWNPEQENFKLEGHSYSYSYVPKDTIVTTLIAGCVPYVDHFQAKGLYDVWSNAPGLINSTLWRNPRLDMDWPEATERAKRILGDKYEPPREVKDDNAKRSYLTRFFAFTPSEIEGGALKMPTLLPSAKPDSSPAPAKPEIEQIVAPVDFAPKTEVHAELRNAESIFSRALTAINNVGRSMLRTVTRVPDRAPGG